MFVVTVVFQVHSHSVDDFAEAVIRQARNSKENEPACHQFDVLQSSEDPTRFFLYETYSDAAAFEAHRQTPYFADFGAAVQPMVASKQSHIYQRIEPAGV